MKRYIFLGIFFLFLVGALFIRGCRAPVQELVYVGRDPSWYPLTTFGKGRNIVAFSDDILVTIGQRQGFKVGLLSIGPDNVLPGLVRGEYDAAMTTARPTIDRTQVFEFSDPYFYTGPVLIVPVGTDMSILRDLKDLRVGVQTGSTVLFEMETYPAVVLQPYDTIIQALEVLLRGEVDALIMDLIPAYTYTIGLYQGTLKIVGQPLTDEGLRLVTPKTRSGRALVGLFNTGLAQLRAEGTFEAFLSKWGLINPVEVLEK